VVKQNHMQEIFYC